ncbi:hypothetical protein ACQPW1_39525 [Nocardia sp. CA-128927]|uniref:hypothetical protein n=1 Tax=Nocardia sp. CA-128927 TaxID=3239975 RepID=UPI003D9593AD
MGYLMSIDRLPYLVRDDTSTVDSFSEPFLASLGRPPAAFPHLCYFFCEVPRQRTTETKLTHVGVVFGQGPHMTPRYIRLDVNNIRALQNPITKIELRSAIRKPHSDNLAKILIKGQGVFTEAADNAIVDAITRLRPEFADILRRLRELRRGTVRSPSADRWELGMDALRTALRIGNFDSERLRMWQAPDDEAAPVLSGIKESPTEKDLIAHDFEAMPGWKQQNRPKVHVRIFSDGIRHMEIVNVDTDMPERVLGVDLIYYHRESRSSVMVQYKKLEEGKEVHVNKRLDDQLDRMEQLSGFNREPGSHEDWRIGQDFCYLKLCRTRTDSGEIDPFNMELLPGLYLPLSYVRLALLDERVLGPRGGRYLGYDRVERYITNTLFLDLAKEGWIGSTGTTREDLVAMVNESRRAGHETIVADDRSPETPRQRLQRQRSRDRGRGQRRALPGQETLF